MEKALIIAGVIVAVGGVAYGIHKTSESRNAEYNRSSARAFDDGYRTARMVQSCTELGMALIRAASSDSQPAGKKKDNSVRVDPQALTFKVN